MCGIGGRRGRGPLVLLLDGAVVHLGGEPLEHVVHGALERLRVVVVQTAVVVGEVRAGLDVGGGRAALGRISTPVLGVPSQLVVAVHHDGRTIVVLQIVGVVLTRDDPLLLVGRRPVLLDAVVHLAARDRSRRGLRVLVEGVGRVQHRGRILLAQIAQIVAARLVQVRESAAVAAAANDRRGQGRHFFDRSRTFELSRWRFPLRGHSSANRPRRILISDDDQFAR